MRRDFRIKVDISRLYQDARQYSWIFVDSVKIHAVFQLADHVKKLFNINEPFHLLSRFDDTYYFLPFQEDIRILENNDTVIIVPGTGISNNSGEAKNDTESPSQSLQPQIQVQTQVDKLSNGFVDSTKSKQTESIDGSEKSSYVTEKSYSGNATANISSAGSINYSLYRTALHDTAINDSVINDTKDSKITEDNFTEDNSLVEETTGSNKRKRVRKRKSKKVSEIVPETDSSTLEISGKKPKIIDSILISSGKHIRFQGLDDEDSSFDTKAQNDNSMQRLFSNGDIKNKQSVNNELASLLNLRQSSTPLTFTHKKAKRDYVPEQINEVSAEMSMDTSEKRNKSLSNFNSTNSTIELEKTKENSQLSKSNADNETVSFKVFRMGADYTPQLSSVILGKILSYNQEGSQYTLKILHGKDQLEDPHGKFSLPNDEEENNEGNDIVTLEKSQLLELSKVTAI